MTASPCRGPTLGLHKSSCRHPCSAFDLTRPHSPTQQVVLNPPNSSEIELGMGIVVLAEDDDSYQPTIAAKIAEGYL